MRAITRGYRRLDDRGAEAVEFALISIPLLTVVYSVIAFGILLFQQISVTQSAREAARTAAICTGRPAASSTSCQDAAQQRFDQNKPAFPSTLSPVQVDQCLTPSPSPTIAVSAKVATTPLLPIPGITSIRGVASTPCGG